MTDNIAPAEADAGADCKNQFAAPTELRAVYASLRASENTTVRTAVAAILKNTPSTSDRMHKLATLCVDLRRALAPYEQIAPDHRPAEYALVAGVQETAHTALQILAYEFFILPSDPRGEVSISSKGRTVCITQRAPRDPLYDPSVPLSRAAALVDLVCAAAGAKPPPNLLAGMKQQHAATATLIEVAWPVVSVSDN